VNAQSIYVVQLNAASDGRIAEPVVIARCDVLSDAVEAMQKSPRTACVVHLPTNLELHKIGDRLLWLDSYGRERPSPE
jgi:hypothetical protein